jgi:hypothetical protein
MDWVAGLWWEMGLPLSGRLCWVPWRFAEARAFPCAATDGMGTGRSIASNMGRMSARQVVARV